MPGLIAQSVEHLAFNQNVMGSSPIQPTIDKNSHKRYNKKYTALAQRQSIALLKRMSWGQHPEAVPY